MIHLFHRKASALEVQCSDGEYCQGRCGDCKSSGVRREDIVVAQEPWGRGRNLIGRVELNWNAHGSEPIVLKARNVPDRPLLSERPVQRVVAHDSTNNTIAEAARVSEVSGIVVGVFQIAIGHLVAQILVLVLTGSTNTVIGRDKVPRAIVFLNLDVENKVDVGDTSASSTVLKRRTLHARSSGGLIFFEEIVVGKRLVNSCLRSIERQLRVKACN